MTPSPKPRTVRVRLLRSLRWIVPLVLGVWIAMRIDFGEVWTRLSGLSVGWLVGALVLFAVSLWIRIVRWGLMLKYLGVPKGPVFRSFALDFAGSALVGEAMGGVARLVDFRNTDADLGTVSYAVVLDKAYELVILIVLLVPATVLLPAGAAEVGPGLLAVTGLILLLIGALPFTSVGERAIRAVARRILKTDGVDSAFASLGGGNHLLLLAQSLVARLVHFGFAWMLALSLDVAISFAEMSAVMVIVGFVLMIPITIGGLGTRDATMIWMFGALGLAASGAAGTSILIFVTTLAFRLIAGMVWAASKPAQVQVTS